MEASFLSPKGAQFFHDEMLIDLHKQIELFEYSLGLDPSNEIARHHLYLQRGQVIQHFNYTTTEREQAYLIQLPAHGLLGPIPPKTAPHGFPSTFPLLPQPTISGLSWKETEGSRHDFRHELGHVQWPQPTALPEVVLTPNGHFQALS